MRHLLLYISLLLAACTGKDQVPDSTPIIDMDVEEIKDVYMIHSDSARVQFTIQSALMHKYEKDNKPVEEFLDGFELIFFDRDKNQISSVRSNYALRRSSDGLLILRDSIIYINEKHDQLQTNGLTINEVEGTISSTKFFRMIRAADQDTIYGRGFTARDDFSKLEVKKYIGKRTGTPIDIRR